jgi:transcriptional regulator with XRE-family HTH domain
MPVTTLKGVAQLAGVAPTTVSPVLNGSQNVAPATREKILAIIRDVDYTPNLHAASLRRRTLPGENAGDLKQRSASANQRPAAGPGSRPPQDAFIDAFIFSPEEGWEVAQHIMRLRRDLDRLRKHTERIQTCLDVIQKACSRRLPGWMGQPNQPRN